MGNMILAATTKSSSSTSLLPILIIVVLFMVVYMTMTRRSRARQAQQMQTGIVPGTRVRTTAGMYGTITSVEGNDDVMVEVAPGVHIRMMRRAVVPLPPDASAGDVPEDEPQDADDAETAQDAAEDHETAGHEDIVGHETAGFGPVAHAGTNGSVNGTEADSVNGTGPDSATAADAEDGETHAGDRNV